MNPYKVIPINRDQKLHFGGSYASKEVYTFEEAMPPSLPQSCSRPYMHHT